MSNEGIILSIASIRRFRAGLFVIGLLCAAAAQSQTDCAWSTGSSFPLTLDGAVVSAKGTDEWSSDVMKVSVGESGLLLVSAEGPEVQALIYTPNPLGGDPILLAEDGIGTGGSILALAVEPGDYCVDIAPPTGATGSVSVRTDFVQLTVASP